nr:hypothetical protein [Kibdelosporangium sp. MJ126-NF4]CTQ91314.1 hypothetical protein [Kibdelosporangium sp. MJ126-NF4]
MWCDRLHEDNLDNGDRLHMSDDVRDVLLSTEDLRISGQVPHKPSDYRPTELVIYLDQHVREVGPRVVVGQLPGDRTKLHLLPAEARQVAQALLDVANLAEGRHLTKVSQISWLTVSKNDRKTGVKGCKANREGRSVMVDSGDSGRGQEIVVADGLASGAADGAAQPRRSESAVPNAEASWRESAGQRWYHAERVGGRMKGR